VAGGASAGSSRAFRLDPFTLPVRYSATLGGGAGARRAEATIFLDRDEAIVKRTSPAGVALTYRVPVKTFDGVAVRMTPVGQAGDIEVTVELMHRDPALSLPLMIADDPADVAADWQAWGRTLGMPLLVVGQDGTVAAPVEQIGAVTLQPAKQRRRHSFFAGRRPRFLTRRKPGRSVAIEILHAREITAWD
jgi:hypothetical protein